MHFIHKNSICARKGKEGRSDYSEEEKGNRDLESLLNQDAFDDGRFGDDVLHVLLGLGVQPILLQITQQDIDSRVDPVHGDGDERAQ